MMDEETFSNFVGADLITKFESYDAILIKEGFTPEFLALHRMWSFFRKPNARELEESSNQHNPTNEPNSFKNDTEKNDESRQENQTFNGEIDSISSQASNTKKVHVIANVLITKDNDSTQTISPDIAIIAPSNEQIGTDSKNKTPSFSPIGKCISDFLKIPEKPERKN
ncbi:uncharacterized protein LOC126737735 [Anthonomus grandis grandis]|uniref:uncharacterized protein LOC126737735 n=1 Tax=Anthonomus grandis grandis TaxID=2921223 RepID=UPI0021657E48|nr:uncharacterized protein LOC126737735 [Anthonomus grandis grandis]